MFAGLHIASQRLFHHHQNLKTMKALNYILPLVLVFLLVTETQAQYQAFTFVTKKDNGKVLTVQNNQLVALSTNTKAGNKATQQFFMKRLSNGNVILANVAYPELCIKRSGTTISLATPGSNTTDFQWRLDFAGNDLYLITNPSNISQALMIQSNNVIKLATVPTFSSNNANQNDSYRFELVKLSNRF